MSTSRTTFPHGVDLAYVRWQKSSYSGGANDCVEIAELGPYVAIRDSKDRQQPPIVCRRSAVTSLMRAVALSWAGRSQDSARDGFRWRAPVIPFTRNTTAVERSKSG
ncbi:DUF397 domain-containing protein [Streptomyces sp. NPDC002187]|uniref:DUF397 domain-containing protein n=1 Tax=Streptomyces sp. NPDC002187 TaxID=3364637 RepID=UPI0036A8C0C6